MCRTTVQHTDQTSSADPDHQHTYLTHPSLLPAECARLLRVQKELVPLCRELGIGMLAYSPMGRGLLTGSFKPDELPEDDFRKTIPGTYYSKENVEAVSPAASLAAEAASRPVV